LIYGQEMPVENENILSSNISLRSDTFHRYDERWQRHERFFEYFAEIELKEVGNNK
jgi:hypothetical protein